MYRLYGVNDWGSQVIHMALGLSGLPYDYVQVDAAAGGMKTPAFLALNPFGRVPVLVTPDGAVIYETAAILMHLEEGCPGLAPAPGSADRPAYLTLFALTTNSLHPLAMALIHPERAGGEAVQAAVAAETHAALRLHLAHYESAAKAGPWWLAGQSPSLLSLYVVMLLRWVQNFAADPAQNIPLADYPALKAMAKGIEDHPKIRPILAAEGLSGPVFSEAEG